jgi:hypothetical protein
MLPVELNWEGDSALSLHCSVLRLDDARAPIAELTRKRVYELLIST